MKKELFIFGLVFMLLVIPNVLAMMSTQNKECLQRGYDIVSGYFLINEGHEDILLNSDIYCLFPDGDYCLNSAFNNGSCGAEFMTENYCIKQGYPVWDSDKCCEGLKSYLPPMIIGHPSCQPFSVRFIGNLIGNPIYWFGIIVFLVLIGYVIYRTKKKRKLN